MSVSLAAIGAALTAWGSCHAARTPLDSSLSVLRLGTAQLSATIPTTGLRQLSQLLLLEGLVRVNDQGRFEGVLADSWNVTNDGRSLVMTLHPGVTFHDGTPLDAETVARLLPEGLKSFWGRLADEVQQITVVANNRIQINFRRSSPLLREMLEVTVRKPGTAIVGTGAFMLSESPTSLRANPDYYGGSPHISEVQVTNFPALRTAWAELLRNRIDMLWEVGPDALDSLQSSTTVAVFTYTRHYQYVLAFNNQTPALRSSAIRRALNMAIDRPTVVQRALNGHGVPSSGPIWPRYWALPSPSRWFEFDPKRASEITNGGRRNGREPAVRFTCLTLADAVYERIALELKRQFQAIDVEMDVREMAPDQLIDAESKGSFDAVLFDVISAPTLLRVYLMWYSRSEGNPGGFGNQSVDAAFDRVTTAETDTAYRQAVASLQQAFLDDPPAIFLAWQQRARAVSKRFAVPPPEAGRDVISTIRLWSPRNNDARLASRN